MQGRSFAFLPRLRELTIEVEVNMVDQGPNGEAMPNVQVDMTGLPAGLQTLQVGCACTPLVAERSSCNVISSDYPSLASEYNRFGDTTTRTVASDLITQVRAPCSYDILEIMMAPQPPLARLCLEAWQVELQVLPVVERRHDAAALTHGLLYGQL